ncbi:MAG: ATP-binding protein [Thermoanaerobaculia bacterium]
MKSKVRTEKRFPSAEGEGPSGRALRLPPTTAALFDAVLVTDSEGVLVETGGALQEVFGHEPDVLDGRPIEDLLIPPHPKKSPPGSHRELTAVARFPYPVRDLEVSARHASGELFAATINVVEAAEAEPEHFVVCVRDVSRLERAEKLRYRIQKELDEHKAELRTLALKLPLDVESERKRIARGLHDQIGNSLTLARMRLGELRQGETGSDKLAALEEVERLTADAMQEIRSLTFELSSPVLYELGLEAALKSLGKRLARQHDIEFAFSTDEYSKPLSENRQVILYRIIEELLFNIVKHAWASRAGITVERANDRLRITVEDDGVGFESPDDKLPGPDGGFGLFGVRQRLEHIDGDLAIEAAFPSGTRMIVTAPLDPDEDF